MSVPRFAAPGDNHQRGQQSVCNPRRAELIHAMERKRKKKKARGVQWSGGTANGLAYGANPFVMNQM